MPDYSKGQIYKIVDVGYNKCYIGSTIESLSQRMARHRTKYTSWKKEKYNFTSSFILFDEYGVDNCKIEWIEDYPCNSKKELDAREGYYQQTVECINKYVSGRSSKSYYKDKCEEIKEQVKQYRKENPDKIRENNSRYFKEKKTLLMQKKQCACGAFYTYWHKERHEKTNKHQQYLQNQNNPQE